MQPFQLYRPTAITEATGLHTVGSAYLAGGHNLIPQLKRHQASLDRVIDLSRIPELHGIQRDGAHLRIGAMTSYSQMVSNPLVAQHIPGLKSLAAQIGDPQLRNRGTIGGSLATNNPESDYPAALLALDGIVETNQGAHLAEDFLNGPFATALADGELITHLRLPIPEASAYAKFAHPASRHPMAGVFVARFDHGFQVAVTGATSACRWKQAEEQLNQNLSVDGLVFDEAPLIGDHLAGPKYRAHVLGVMLQGALADMAHPHS